MRTRRVGPWLVRLGAPALAVAVAAAAAGAQSPAQPAPQPAGRGRMGAMAQGRGAMRAEMDAQARRLDELVAAMNAAPDSAKLERMTAVLNELVAQHKAMHARMAAMPMMSGAPETPAAPAQGAPPAGGAHDQHH